MARKKKFRLKVEGHNLFEGNAISGCPLNHDIHFDVAVS